MFLLSQAAFVKGGSRNYPNRSKYKTDFCALCEISSIIFFLPLNKYCVYCDTQMFLNMIRKGELILGRFKIFRLNIDFRKNIS